MHSHYLKVFLFVLCFAFVGDDVYAQYPGFNAPSTRVTARGAIGLVPVTANIDGGSIPIGALSQIVVLFRNEGTQPVQTGKINLYPSSNISAEISLNQCAVDSLPSGAECALAISVKGLQAGSWRLEMLMSHSGRTRLVTTTLSGRIDASGDTSDALSSDIEAIPTVLDFASLASNQAVVESVILRNITSTPIQLSEIFIKASKGSGYSVEADCPELKPGQACIATVTWSPKRAGSATGVLVIKHGGATGLTSVSLNGDYVPDIVNEAQIFPEAIPGRGLLISSQTVLDFGGGIASASTITVSLVNAGDASLAFENIKISGSDNGLSIGKTGCAANLILAPVEACPLTLTWSPTRVGALLDDIQISHDGTRGILVLPIRGVAGAVVNQNQKAIVLKKEGSLEKAHTRVLGNSIEGIAGVTGNVSAISTLDGLKITSFAATRAIVNGPGGSRLLFNGEQVILGGVVWDVHIQKDGIVFSSGEERVLLLFDRSLSSFNRISRQSSNAAPLSAVENQSFE